MRVALGIRARLLLVLTVFLALPWLGYQYVRELERFLRDAQERALASTAQAVSIALNDRPRLFADAADPIASFAQERADEEPRDGLPPSASPEIARIVQGLSRTTARVWVIDRAGVVVATGFGRDAAPAVRAGAHARRGGMPAGPRPGLVPHRAGSDTRWRSTGRRRGRPVP